MTSKKKEAERKRRQAKWERENAAIEEARRVAPAMKAALKAKGCDLPFYESIDSAEDEFNRLVAWAKSTRWSLRGVFEMPYDEIDIEADWQRFGIPDDWVQLKYDCSDELAESYTARDKKANLRGAATGFRNKNGEFCTIIQVVRNFEYKFEHKERKYLLKLPVLLHEIGHVMDFEEKINFDRDTGRADFIEAEVYANVFALESCFERGYFMAAEVFLESLSQYKADADHRGEVVRRLLKRFSIPAYRKWVEYDVNPS